MSDELTAEEVEAIRQVIMAGVSGDFADVAAVVERQFGLQVGPIAVEQVYRLMQQEANQQPAQEGEEMLKKVLDFARDFGGFDQARAALDAVENKLREQQEPGK